MVYREPRLDTGPKSVGLLLEKMELIFETQVRPLYRERVKDEVYIATGVRPVLFHHGHHHRELNHGHDHQELLHDGQVGGGLLLLVIVVSLGLVSRYRRKFMEGKASKYDHNNMFTRKQ